MTQVSAPALPKAEKRHTVRTCLLEVLLYRRCNPPSHLVVFKLPARLLWRAAVRPVAVLHVPWRSLLHQEAEQAEKETPIHGSRMECFRCCTVKLQTRHAIGCNGSTAEAADGMFPGGQTPVHRPWGTGILVQVSGILGWLILLSWWLQLCASNYQPFLMPSWSA